MILEEVRCTVYGPPVCKIKLIVEERECRLQAESIILILISNLTLHCFWNISDI